MSEERIVEVCGYRVDLAKVSSVRVCRDGPEPTLLLRVPIESKEPKTPIQLET